MDFSGTASVEQKCITCTRISAVHSVSTVLCIRIANGHFLLRAKQKSEPIKTKLAKIDQVIKPSLYAEFGRDRPSGGVSRALFTYRFSILL